MRHVQARVRFDKTGCRRGVTIVLAFAVPATACLLLGVGGGVLYGKLAGPRLDCTERMQDVAPDRGMSPLGTDVPGLESPAPSQVVPVPVALPEPLRGEEDPEPEKANAGLIGAQPNESPRDAETAIPADVPAEDASTAPNAVTGLPASAPATPATRLVIPSLAVDAPVVLLPLRDGTWDVSQITLEVGHLQGTASPGEDSNLALAGHITLAQGGYGPFKDLAQLKAGDEMLVFSGPASFRYAVERMDVVDPTSVEITFPSDRPLLTLITCANWDDSTQRYADRIAVVAHLVE